MASESLSGVVHLIWVDMTLPMVDPFFHNPYVIPYHSHTHLQSNVSDWPFTGMMMIGL